MARDVLNGSKLQPHEEKIINEIISEEGHTPSIHSKLFAGLERFVSLDRLYFCIFCECLSLTITAVARPEELDKYITSPYNTIIIKVVVFFINYHMTKLLLSEKDIQTFFMLINKLI
jgi:hypothetical protein